MDLFKFHHEKRDMKRILTPPVPSWKGVDNRDDDDEGEKEEVQGERGKGREGGREWTAGTMMMRVRGGGGEGGGRGEGRGRRGVDNREYEDKRETEQV